MQTQVYTGKQLSQKFGQETQLKEVISGLENEMWEQGEVICEIYLNGEFLNESDESALANTPVTGIESISLLSRNQEELIDSTISTIYEWIPKVKLVSERVSKDIRTGKGGESSGDFVSLVENCEWVSESLSLLKPILLRDNERLALDWNKAEEYFSVVAKEALMAFEKNDIVLLADILEFDLPKSLDNWNKIFEQNLSL